MIDRVDIDANDHTIPGVLTLPPAESSQRRHPAVLLLHGTGSQKDEVGDLFVRFADQLGARGIASLRIDLPGAGESALQQTAYTYASQVSDAGTALTWLENHQQVDPERLAVLGFSQGGRVVATIAGTDKRVRALAGWAPWMASGAHSIVKRPGFREGYVAARQDGHAPVDIGFRTWDFSLEWFETIEASDPLGDLANYAGPLLAVVGTEDELTDPQEARDFAYYSGSYDTTLRVIPGSDHIFNVLTPDQSDVEFVMDMTADWFAGKLS